MTSVDTLNETLPWVNRLLFLKLLEGQLLSYHGNDNRYRFMSSDSIVTFDQLFNLFHKVLAVDYIQRQERLGQQFSHVPYLNSSLFEISQLERVSISVQELDGDISLPVARSSVLRGGKSEYRTLEYLLRLTVSDS